MRDPQEPAERPEGIRPDPRVEDALRSLNLAISEADGPVAPPYGGAERLAAVFVVGAPRSGTTLLSQLLSKYLRVGYVDNVVARFWMRPSAGIALSRSILGPGARSRIVLESRHGTTHQPEGPHEFGYFWRQRLALDGRTTHHPDSDPAIHADVAGLRTALRGELLGQFGLPTVFKNPICGLHAPTIVAAHARSVFVHIVRERTATCASILRSRIDRLGSADRWWSLKPSTFRAISAIDDPARQVMAQVEACRDEIDAAIAASGADAVRLDYERVCADPAEAIHAVAVVCGAEQAARVDAKLLASAGPALDPALAAMLAAARGSR